jgi:DNA-binding transcriptional ArsR family regulator
VVTEDAATAAVAIDPVRARLLAALREPGSASSMAAALGMSRQNVNHYLRALERHGLVELVEERRKGPRLAGAGGPAARSAG